MKTFLIYSILFIYPFQNNYSNKPPSLDLIGDWCVIYDENILRLNKRPPIMQCSGMTIMVDGRVNQYIAPNIFVIWNWRIIAYEIYDSIVHFKTIDKSNKINWQCYKLKSKTEDEIVLEQINCR